MSEEAYLNDNCKDCPCDDEILDILIDTCIDLEHGEEYELDTDDFKRVFKANYKKFNTEEYFIMFKNDYIKKLK